MMRKDYRLAIEHAWLQLQRMHIEINNTDNDTRYQVYNISRGGLRFASTENFASQERIKVTVHLPNNTEHQTLARICYCEAEAEQPMTFYGVSFLENFLDMTPFQK